MPYLLDIDDKRHLHADPEVNSQDLPEKKFSKIWNASQMCMSSLYRRNANLLCIGPVSVYVLLKQAPEILIIPFYAYSI